MTFSNMGSSTISPSKWWTVEGMTWNSRLDSFEKGVSFYKPSNQLKPKQTESKSPQAPVTNHTAVLTGSISEHESQLHV